MKNAERVARQVSFYGRGLLRQVMPLSMARRQRDAMLAGRDRHPDRSEIDRRIAYYNKVAVPFDASAAPRIADIDRSSSRYFLDLDQYARGFGPDRRLYYLFGDIVTVPDRPTVLKSRPIAGDNANSVLLKLGQLRHFKWSTDPVPFRAKSPTAVWRGTPLTEQRRQLVRMFHDHPSFDIGHSRDRVDRLPAKRSLTRAEQMQHRFFVSLEGNDVATNLKWAMASNMLVMAPRPKYETWFMEGLLEPGVHFVLLRDDLTDLEEKVDHYASRPAEAEEIVGNAHRWIGMFADPLKEGIISTWVLQTYFRASGQI